MRKFIFLFIMSTGLYSSLYSQTNQVWMLGPMVHFNFAHKEIHISYGLELSYWNYDAFPYSIDGGMEFEKGKVRLYSEGQIGLAIAGISLGPVYEFRKGETNKLGFQGSLWANYFGGVDFRYRRIGSTSFISPGVYLKLPLVSGEGDGDGDGDHHWSDWD